jgi:3-isopropylmalate dehydrogenase
VPVVVSSPASRRQSWFDKIGHLRPEAGLLRIRRELGAYANLRPAVFFPALEDSSPLRAEIVRGTDIMIVRELLGGAYFGQPRSIEGEPGARVAVNTMRYAEHEGERISRVAFDLAMKRKKKVLSGDKANVLECSRLARVVTRIAKDYRGETRSPIRRLRRVLLVQRPTDFDVVLTENMFGDILSDQAGGVVGSLACLPLPASAAESASTASPRFGPDIAGKELQPLGAILSGAMLLRHSFHLSKRLPVWSMQFPQSSKQAQNRRPGRKVPSLDHNAGDGKPVVNL